MKEDEESYIVFHSGNVVEVLKKMNISSAHTDDTGDFMSSCSNQTGKQKTKKSRVGMISTNRMADTRGCYLCKYTSDQSSPSSLKYECCKFDSHADTYCAGITSIVLEYTGKHVMYIPTVQAINQEGTYHL